MWLPLFILIGSLTVLGADAAFGQTITALAEEDRTMFVAIGCCVMYALGLVVGRR